MVRRRRLWMTALCLLFASGVSFGLSDPAMSPEATTEVAPEEASEVTPEVTPEVIPKGCVEFVDRMETLIKGGETAEVLRLLERKDCDSEIEESAEDLGKAVAASLASAMEAGEWAERRPSLVKLVTILTGRIESRRHTDEVSPSKIGVFTSPIRDEFDRWVRANGIVPDRLQGVLDGDFSDDGSGDSGSHESDTGHQSWTIWILISITWMMILSAVFCGWRWLRPWMDGRQVRLESGLTNRLLELRQKINLLSEYVDGLAEDGKDVKNRVAHLKETVTQIRDDQARPNTGAVKLDSEFRLLSARVRALEQASKVTPEANETRPSASEVRPNSPTIVEGRDEEHGREAPGVSHLAAGATEPSASSLFLSATYDRERVILRKVWSHFQDGSKRLYDVDIRDWIAGMKRSASFRVFRSVVEQLPAMLSPDGEARRALLHMHRVMEGMLRLARVPLQIRQVEGEDRDEERLVEYRELANFLVILETTVLGEEILTFEPQRWLRDGFLPVAEEVLRAGAEDGAVADSSDARHLVEEALRVAELRPMEILPRRTVFDGRLHDASSQERDPSVPGGVILSIVRFGFLAADSTPENPKVRRRAVVTVNRV